MGVALVEERLKTCFVVGPIGNEGSAIRLEADWLLDEIIAPALKMVGGFADPVRSDRQEQPGMIDAQMFAHLFDDDLVIADMTGLNANAFYEMGIRHMKQKPIIHMHQEGTPIPFDVGAHRSILYSRAHPEDMKKARAALASQISETQKPDFKVMNPVTSARGRIQLEESSDPMFKTLLDTMQSLSNRMSNLENTSFYLTPYAGDAPAITTAVPGTRYLLGGTSGRHPTSFVINIRTEPNFSVPEIVKSISSSQLVQPYIQSLGPDPDGIIQLSLLPKCDHKALDSAVRHIERIPGVMGMTVHVYERTG